MPGSVLAYNLGPGPSGAEENVMGRAAARINRNLSAFDAEKMTARSRVIARRHRDLGTRPLDGQPITLTSEDRACLGPGRTLTTAQADALRVEARRMLDMEWWP